MGDGTYSWNEADRVAELRSYDILDAPTGTTFDDFVQIAADVCDAPIAVVNLIDEARQWFAAEIGLGVRETPLDVSICAHAILQRGVFVVPDLTRDHRFDCNPLVAGPPALRFYGGALLESPGGLPLGTMCVLDYKPRPEGLTERQSATLQALARQVIAQLELRRANAQKDLLVLEAHHRVKNSLQMVQSLLMLQAGATVHPDAAQQLRESAARVHTFGVMHEHLYKVGAAVQVDLEDYVRSLVDNQKTSLASMLPGRDIALHASRIPWPSSDAASVGLILTELVTNALKYGAGTITVTLRQAGDEVVLTVADEGTSLPVDFECKPGPGLGMRVIVGLLRSHHGRLEVDRARGHTCIVATWRAASWVA